MNRALLVWKLKLCLAAAAAILASAMAPQRPAHEQQTKDNKSKLQIVVDDPKAKTPAAAPTRPPAKIDSRERLSAVL